MAGPLITLTTDFGDFPLPVPAEQGDGVDVNYAPRRIVRAPGNVKRVAPTLWR